MAYTIGVIRLAPILETAHPVKTKKQAKLIGNRATHVQASFPQIFPIIAGTANSDQRFYMWARQPFSGEKSPSLY